MASLSLNICFSAQLKDRAMTAYLVNQLFDTLCIFSQLLDFRKKMYSHLNKIKLTRPYDIADIDIGSGSPYLRIVLFWVYLL